MRDAAAQLSDRHLRAHPALHFTPPQGWLNDPNGLITWRDKYHLFYQHNPRGIQHLGIHWGHAVSEDLLEWRHLPIALAPDPSGPDRDGCFSGDATLHKGVPALIYSGHRDGGELPCLAFPSELEELTTWDKYPGNPVIRHPPPGFGRNGFRDHCVWRERNEYYQVIGASSADGRGAALLYRSKDLVDWEYLGPLFVAPDASLGWMWECPDFYRAGDSWVLIVSVLGGAWDHSAAYFVGEFRDGRFRPETQGVVDGGSRLYAPQTFVDREGRRILLGWLREDPSELDGADWCGWMSLPRILSLGSDRRLRSAPLPELSDRRRMLMHLPIGAPKSLADTQDSLEIELSGALSRGGEWDLLIRYRDPDAPDVVVRWSGRDGVRIEVEGAPLPLSPHDSTSDGADVLRVFLDRGSIEVYAGGTAAAELLHLQDTRVASVEVRSGSQSNIVSGKVWELQSPSAMD